MILLIDERPEEVTDIRRSVRADVFDSTFDSPQETTSAWRTWSTKERSGWWSRAKTSSC
ncbi:MAG: hypothetical protein ACLR4A_15420 [Christensenellales bacterium]